MKQATFLVIGLLTTLMFLALSCGGDDATAAPRPRSTNTPVVAAEPTATPAPPTTTAVPAVDTSAAAGIDLEISVNGDALEFDSDRFTVGAGSQVTLTFDNVSTAFQHNWVLVRNGTADAVAQRGTSHPTTDWLEPDDPDVLANTKLLNQGTTGSVTFTAPANGTYQFVCTFPGHNVTMFGTFETGGY